MGEEEGKKKREVVVESLGWLTESSIMPKKHKAIAGVGPSSILELKAQLYKTQQEQSRKSSNDPSASDLQFRRPKKKIPPTDFSAKNSGVEARANKYSSYFNNFPPIPVYCFPLAFTLPFGNRKLVIRVFFVD